MKRRQVHNVKVRTLRSELKKAGFLLRQGGNHQVWAAPDGVESVTLPDGTAGKDADPRTVLDVREAIASHTTRVHAAQLYQLRPKSKEMAYYVAVAADPRHQADYYANRLNYISDVGGNARATLTNLQRKGALHLAPGPRPRNWAPGPQPVAVDVDAAETIDAVLETVSDARPVPSAVELMALQGQQYTAADLELVVAEEEEEEEELPSEPEPEGEPRARPVQELSDRGWEVKLNTLEAKYEQACQDVEDARSMLTEAENQRDELEPVVVKAREALSFLKEVLS